MKKTLDCSNQEALNRLTRIESMLLESLPKIAALAVETPAISAIDKALTGSDGKSIQKSIVATQSAWLRKFSIDKSLGFPHRKILEFLLTQYDPQTNKYKEVHFSRLVKEACIGKNRAQTYLKLLEEREYIARRYDGYRLFFRILG